MLANLVSEMQRISNNQVTGILFLVSGDNRSAQISFLDGKMVYALCQGKKGGNALDLVANMSELRFRFQEGAIPPLRIDMPSLSAFSSQLLKKNTVARGDKTIVKTKNDHAPLSGSQQSKGQSLDENQKKIIQEVLADCIGPMASILCEDHLDSKNTVEDVIEAIAAEIPADQATRFKDIVLRRLQ